MTPHPIEQFEAPNSIQTGVPLKSIISGGLVDLIGASIQRVYSEFDLRKFSSAAKTGLEEHELKARANHIAEALAATLPEDLEQSAQILIESLGPELDSTKDYGLRPFFYLAHAEWIARLADTHFETGMQANYELTKRFTAEFSIRPFIIADLKRSLALLNEWTMDPNPHVRRLVSEGSRPRLPWAMRLKEIDKQPAHSLPLLEKLKDDPELYVRRSVANHLGDIGKNNLPVLLETCERWLRESDKMSDATRSKNRKWVIRHALRHPAKKQNADALKLRSAAA